MNEPIVTMIGNLAGDPELRLTPSGISVCKMRMAMTPRVKDGDGWKDGEPFWQDVTAWRELGENCAETLHKGDRIVVFGRLTQRQYEKDGVKRTAWDLDADAIGPDLKYARATVRRQPKGDGSTPATGGTAKVAAPNADTQRASQPAASPW